MTDEERREKNRLKAQRYRAAHHEAHLAYRRKWAKEHYQPKPKRKPLTKKERREKNRLKMRAYRARNRNQFLAWRRKHYAEHREELLAYKRKPEQRARNRKRLQEWKVEHPFAYRVYRATARSKLFKVKGRFTVADVMAKLVKQKGKCHWCKKLLGGTFDVDHVKPMKKRGLNTAANIVLACPTCNRGRDRPRK